MDALPTYPPAPGWPPGPGDSFPAFQMTSALPRSPFPVGRKVVRGVLQPLWTLDTGAAHPVCPTHSHFEPCSGWELSGSPHTPLVYFSSAVSAACSSFSKALKSMMSFLFMACAWEGKGNECQQRVNIRGGGLHLDSLPAHRMTPKHSRCLVTYLEGGVIKI